jgi:hypothetical protein
VSSLQAELAMVQAANRQAAAAAAALVQQHHHQHLQQQLISQQTTGAAGVMQLQQLQEAAHQPTHEIIMSPAHLPNISIISGSSTTAGQGNTIMYANRSSIKEENINMQQQQQQQQAHQVQQQRYVTEMAAGMSNPSSGSHGQLRSLMNTDQSNFHKFLIPPRHRDRRDHQQLQQHDPAATQLHEHHHHRYQITSDHQGRSAGAAVQGADHHLMMSHESFASLLPRK